MRFGCKLRLVVGDRLDKHHEPWYILTTDLTSSVADIIKIYYYRFEIEELFRDIKSLLHTKGSRLKKPLNLATLLWYVCLGILLLYLSRSKVGAQNRTLSMHPNKKLSTIRILFEEFEKELRQLVCFKDKKGYG